MAELDRTGFIELLGRLGAEKDETVLAAARELHRKVVEAGVTWDDLLRPEDEPVAASEDETASEEATAEPAGHTTQQEEALVSVPANRAEDMRLIERLLARKDISDTLRSDLKDFKRAIAEGTFDKMDADYLRALAKRLGA